MTEIRRAKRAVTDLSKITAILNGSHIIHTAINTEDFPYVVPTNYGFEIADNGKLTLYIHGAPEGRKVDLIKRDNRVGFEIDDGGSLMPTESTEASHNSWLYHSIIGTGVAHQVTGTEGKLHALQQVLIHETGHAWKNIDPHGVEYVNVYRIDVQEYKAKQHEAPQAQ
ncbi:putative 5-nitroimidazole antibiotic resistance 3 [Furfurilactobacillus rossiae]|uniref:pyridoxamine 5'-phosphate oxidase family protein n=1 Tax=Furfurilactobacillus rossiae TaxID=231049 RepID=UPI0015BF0C8E|nr:pyridoxamine 5'-phosphate oxidase family protein [Furfurilactobacillus rossiae]MCF6166577.1 pyridoxamine 5'-phosphate oxidase family protein [Furfurilactobacillus rossiae]QLE64323.1 putative 5-nitroimidazole antibiotic resistance 3 [Furfurilactobacillus rossiae]